MKSAVISDCGTYRYFLLRGEQNQLPFIMLNPSTADDKLDDPTIRRCISFAKSFGYDGIVVLNLYALRATNPKELWTHDDPVGPDNDLWLTGNSFHHREVVCAWGANAKPDRVKQVADMLTGLGVKLKCLGTTKAGAPRHPLYVKGDTPLIDWEYK